MGTVHALLEEKDRRGERAEVVVSMFSVIAPMGTLFSRAWNRDERRFQATRQDVAKTLLLFRRTIAALRLMPRRYPQPRRR